MELWALSKWQIWELRVWPRHGVRLRSSIRMSAGMAHMVISPPICLNIRRLSTLHWHQMNWSWFWPWYTFGNISGFCAPRIDTANSHPVFCERNSNWIIFVKRIQHLDILVVLISISLLILYLFSCILSFSLIICSSKLILLLFFLFLINRKNNKWNTSSVIMKSKTRLGWFQVPVVTLECFMITA